MSSPTAVSHSNIWPCCDFDFDPHDLETKTLHLSMVKVFLSKSIKPFRT